MRNMKRIYQYSLPQSFTACTAFVDTSIRSASIAVTLLWSGCVLLFAISFDSSSGGVCKCPPLSEMSSAFVSDDDITWESSRWDDPEFSPSSQRKMEDIADITTSSEVACNYLTAAGARKAWQRKNIDREKEITVFVVVVYCAIAPRDLARKREINKLNLVLAEASK